MARIRTIKPEFFRHGGLFDAEKETGLPLRLSFAGLWIACDKEGRFKWKPRELKLDVLPFDEVDFSRVLDALATRGHIVKYACDGNEYGCIPSWHQHQVINNRETESYLPPPPEIPVESITSTRAARVPDASTTGAPRDEHAGLGEGKGREGKDASTHALITSELSDVPMELVNDWLKVRKAKKAPLTKTAISGMRKQAEKAGVSMTRAVEVSTELNWQAFRADWYADRQPKVNGSHFGKPAEDMDKIFERGRA